MPGNHLSYPDILSLNPQDIRYLEQHCKKQKHLGNESILETIQQDLAILNSLNISKMDLYNTHLNMILKLNKTNYYKSFTTFETDNAQINKLIDSAPDELLSWSCSGTICNQIDINNQTLLVYCFMWSKNETCPIEKYFNKDCASVDFGNKDFFVANLTNGKSMWVPDLVMRQIGLFGFFQGELSKYRIDPLKYIEVMGITDNLCPINPINVFTTNRWFNRGQITGKIKNVSKRLQSESYKVYMYGSDNKICIKVTDNEWMNKMDGEFIDVFGTQLMVSVINNSHKWYTYENSHGTYLVNGDCTMEINNIMVREKSIHKERGKIILNELMDTLDPINYVVD